MCACRVNDCPVYTRQPKLDGSCCLHINAVVRVVFSCSCRPVRSVSCPPSQSERVATPACRVRQPTALPRPSSSSASTNTRQHSTRIRLDTCVGNCCLFVCSFIDRGRLSPPPCYINRTGIIFRPFSGYRPLHYRRFSRFYGTQKQRRIGVLGGGRSARRAASSAHANLSLPHRPPLAAEVVVGL